MNIRETTSRVHRTPVSDTFEMLRKIIVFIEIKFKIKHVTTHADFYYLSEREKMYLYMRVKKFRKV